MKVGLCCAGMGEASTGDFIAKSARAAEHAGFSSFWFPDHIVLFATYPDSSYPYSGMLSSGDPIKAAQMPLAETIMAMTWAAAATTRIEVGSDVIILPQRNPVILAKQLSTLDEFSGGRVVLGAGIGWAQEEYRAIGADWPARGKHMDDYVAALRALWREEASTFEGDIVAFKAAYMFPKPLHGDIPIVFGGESEAALKRVARVGDGWFPFNIPVDHAAERIAHLKRLTRAQNRDPDGLRIYAPIFASTPRHELERYREAGVTEFYLVLTGSLPIEDAAMSDCIAEMGERFVTPLAGW